MSKKHDMEPAGIRSKRVGALTACIALVAGAMWSAASEAAATPIPTAVPSFCREHKGGYRCEVGPFDVAPDERKEIVTGVAAPAASGYITRARPSLVDGDGNPVGHHMVHLHHAVWLNPYEDDTTCDSYDNGTFPDLERFFATGKELTKAVMPQGYGYLWDPPVAEKEFQSTPWWALVAHLDGMHGSSDVYIRLDIDLVPLAKADGYKGFEPIWLDVRNCRSDPVYDVSKHRGVDRETWTYRMPVGGRFVFLGGHLHDGGLRIALRNATRDKKLFTSRAKYGLSSDPWFLTGMSTWRGSPGLRVHRGDRLKLTSVYDASRRWNDVMGIMLGALVPGR